MKGPQKQNIYQSYKTDHAHNYKNNNNKGISNNLQNGLYISSSQDSSHSQQQQQKSEIQFIQPINNQTPTTDKSISRGMSPTQKRKIIIEDENNRMKQQNIIQQQCSRMRQKQLENEYIQQQQLQEKRILNEFLKYNSSIQKTTDEYINGRKSWNKEYDIAKNKRILSIKDEEKKQNTITIAQYVVNHSQLQQISFQQQFNNSLHPSLRQSPKQQQQQKENIHPDKDSINNVVSDKDQQNIQQNQDQIDSQNNVIQQEQSQNIPLKIYQNKKVYKNQYANQISNNINNQSKQQQSQQQSPLIDKDTLKINYIETDLNTFYVSPCYNGKNNKFYNNNNNQEMNFSLEKKQRAQSVVVKRPNSSQHNNQNNNNILQKNPIKNRIQQNQSDIPNDLQQLDQNKRILKKLQIDDILPQNINQIIPQYHQNQTTKQDSFSLNYGKLQQQMLQQSSSYRYAHSTKSTFKDQDNHSCQTEPNTNLNQINNKLFQKDSLQTQLNIPTEQDQSFFTTETNYNSRNQYKNNGRRFRSQTRASSQNHQQIYQNQISPEHFNHVLNQTEELEPLLNNQNISIIQQQQQKLDHQINQNDKKQNNNNNIKNEGDNLKYNIQNILRTEQDLIKNTNINNNKNNLQKTDNNNEDEINDFSTDLTAYQYIEKLKREKKRRLEEEQKRFQREKEKMNEQFNEFCIKRQLANVVVSEGNRSLYNHEIQTNNTDSIIKNPKDLYQVKNHIKMQEISHKCQKIYDECISQIDLNDNLSFTNPKSNNEFKDKNNEFKDLKEKNELKESNQFTLPRLSPLNSTKNSASKHYNDNYRDQKMYQKNNNINNNNLNQINDVYNNQQKGNRSQSTQPLSTKSSNSKPITISMQKFLNDSDLKNKSQIQKQQQIESTIQDKHQQQQQQLNSQQSQQYSNDESTTNSQDQKSSSQCSSPKQIKKVQINEQIPKKRIVKIKDYNITQSQSQSQSQDKSQSKTKNHRTSRLNSIQNSEQKINSLNNDSIIQNNQDNLKYATKINLNLNDVEINNNNKQNNEIYPVIENKQNINNINNNKNSLLTTPKSILKQPREKSDSPIERNKITTTNGQDFTLGFDSFTHLSLDQQMHPSQPTQYSHMYESKKNIDNNNNIKNNNSLKQSNSLLKKTILQNQTQFLRENDISSPQSMIVIQTDQIMFNNNENEGIYRVQQSSLDSSIKFSQDFGYNKQNNNDESDHQEELLQIQNNDIQARFSFQNNNNNINNNNHQITEASNTEDEISQENMKNLIKNMSQQGSKFSFFNKIKDNNNNTIQDGQGSVTAFSQKIIPPMQILHQSKLIQDSFSPQLSQTRLLISQLQILSNEKDNNYNNIQQSEQKQNGNIDMNQINNNKISNVNQNQTQQNINNLMKQIENVNVLPTNFSEQLNVLNKKVQDNHLIKQKESNQNNSKKEKEINSQNNNNKMNSSISSNKSKQPSSPQRRNTKPNVYQIEQMNNNQNEIQQYLSNNNNNSIKQDDSQIKQHNINNENDNQSLQVKDNNKNIIQDESQQKLNEDNVIIIPKESQQILQNNNKKEQQQCDQQQILQQNNQESNKIQQSEQQNQQLQQLKQQQLEQKQQLQESKQQQLQDNKIKQYIQKQQIKNNISVEDSQFVIDLRDNNNNQSILLNQSKIDEQSQQQNHINQNQTQINQEQFQSQLTLKQNNVPLIIDHFF